MTQQEEHTTASFTPFSRLPIEIQDMICDISLQTSAMVQISKSSAGVTAFDDTPLNPFLQVTRTSESIQSRLVSRMRFFASTPLVCQRSRRRHKWVDTHNQAINNPWS
jgi:hypothetical protein